jgi:NAD(P)-dependent dehydrogenase (short-subunit alcohol dehydrogenase family)
MRKVAAVVGVGVGIGGEVAKALSAAGYDVGVFARNQSYKGANKLAPLVRELGEGRAWGIVMDAAEPASVKSGFAELRRQSGGRGVSVLVYNAGARRMGARAVESQEASELMAFWRVNAFGAFLCAQEVWGDMTAAGEGTILFTG